jgi:hypothetical protein
LSIFSRFLFAVTLVLSLLFSAPAHAAMLMPFGGWVIDEHVLMRVYTDYAKILRVSAQNILRYDSDGVPDTETITWVDYPFDGKSTALGFRHCKSNPESTQLVAIYSPDDNIVHKAWLFDGKKFNWIDEKTVTCDKSFTE